MTNTEQTSLQRRVYNTELLVGLVVLILLALGSMLMTHSPSTEEITTSFMQQVPEQDKSQYRHVLRRMMMTQPELASSPHRWSHELNQLRLSMPAHAQ